jgi:Fe-S-cluster containining protein
MFIPFWIPGYCADSIGMSADMIHYYEKLTPSKGTVMQPIKKRPSQAKTQCTRCGTCCEKGGPSFHIQDRRLIEDGIIHTRYLYTIRRGELVHDNVQGHLKAAGSDIIKIKGKRPSWECVFFQKTDTSCSIYDHRPLECRLLKCWDTRDIEAVYEKERLTRQDILAEIEGLWELVAGHEKQCGYDVINRALQDSDGVFKKQAQELIATAIQYDRAIRQLVLENGNVTPDMIDFLFGRPLTVTLIAAGYTIEKGA